MEKKEGKKERDKMPLQRGRWNHCSLAIDLQESASWLGSIDGGSNVEFDEVRAVSCGCPMVAEKL